MPANVSIRRAEPRDLERVAEIKVRNWADTYGSLIEPAALAQFLELDKQVEELRGAMHDAETLLLVAESTSGEVMGFALTYIDQRPDPWLESLHVLHGFRSHGAGTMLMRQTAAELIARGHRTLRLGVVSGNQAAEQFYVRLGATHIGREPASWAPGVWHELYRWADIAGLTIRPR